LLPVTGKRREQKKMKINNILLTLALAFTVSCQSAQTEASWYGEKYRGKSMANGKAFNPDLPVIASWDYPFGTILELTYRGKKVRGVVWDRGPARKLYHKGRKLDLSKSLFKKLVGDTDIGIADISYRKVGQLESYGYPKNK
jgi:rare lipoprotein A